MATGVGGDAVEQGWEGHPRRERYGDGIGVAVQRRDRAVVHQDGWDPVGAAALTC